MATSFPTGLDALTNPTGASSLTSPDHAGQHADANDAIESLQAKVGVNGSAVTSSLDYKIANIPATSITTGTLNNSRLPAAATTITSVGTLSALRVDGNFGIGINGLAQTGLRISKAISGSAYAQGIFLDGTIQPSVTSRSDMIWTTPSVADAVTLPEINHFYASSPAIGTGSTITAVTGYKAEANLGNNYSGTVTNVYAFSGNIASGTGRWNFFASGTANNYMAGRLGVGLGLTSGAMAQVVNTTAADKAFIIRGAASQSGDFLDVQNSGGTSRFKVDSLGYVGIGTATPLQPAGYGALTIDGSSGSIILGRVAGTETFRIQSTATSTTLNSITALPILFSTTNTERMRIDSVGNVGIGTTTPSSYGLLSVGASIGASTIKNMIAMRQSAGVDSATMRIAGYAYTGNARTAIDFVQNGATNFASQMVFSTSAGADAVERMRITSAGLVGIGTTTPAEKLTIANGNANITNGTLSIARTSYPVIELNQSGSTGVGQIAMNGNDLEIRQTQAFNMKLYTANTERMRIDSVGNVGIGATPSAFAKVHIGGTLPSSSNLTQVFRSVGTIPSTSTSGVWGYLSAITTQAASFNVTNLFHFSAEPGAKGEGSTITNQYGFFANSVLTEATNNYGFYGAIASDTNRWNLYMGGTAQNYLAGNTGIGVSVPTVKLEVRGSTTIGSQNNVAATFGTTTSGRLLVGSITGNTPFIGSEGASNLLFTTNAVERMRITSAGLVGIGVTPTSMFHVVNTIAANKALVVKGAGSQLGSLFEAQNSSGTALVTINSVGKVGIGNTAPENTLDITGSFGRGNPAVKTANFTLAGTENWIICNGAGTISITLPTPSTCDGREFGIKTVSPQLVNSASANVIAIGGGAAGTAILPATSGAWAILVSDGASWNIMCRGT